LLKAIEELSINESVTKFIILLAVFDVLLHKLSGKEDLTVLSSFSGRSFTEIENLIGYFNNTLPIRLNLLKLETLTFRKLLEHIRKIVLEAYDHRVLPFGEMKNFFSSEPKNSCHKKASLSVKFLYDNFLTRSVNLPELKIDICQSDIEILTNSDLILFITETKDWIHGQLIGRENLFDIKQMSTIADDYCYLMEKLLVYPDQIIDNNF